MIDTYRSQIFLYLPYVWTASSILYGNRDATKKKNRKSCHFNFCLEVFTWNFIIFYCEKIIVYIVWFDNVCCESACVTECEMLKWKQILNKHDSELFVKEVKVIFPNIAQNDRCLCSLNLLELAIALFSQRVNYFCSIILYDQKFT